jgi:tetratricopeptide (TPR) repeat protein
MKTTTLTRLALVLLLAVISAPATRPQENKSDKSAVSHQEWPSKQQAKHDRYRSEPQDGAEWFDRAYEMHNSDRYPEAIEAFKHAVDLGYRKSTAMYNIACGYSLLNDKDNALVWLQRALENGFDSTGHIAHDPDLDPLRTDQRFKTLLSNIPADNDSERTRNESGYVKTDRLEKANLAFARLESEASKDGDAWAQVGLQLLLLRDLDRSIVALSRAADYLDYKGSTAMYNLACSYALKGDRDAGIKWLEKSVNTGFDSPKKLQYDPDILSLRTDPRFAAIENLSKTLSLSQFRHDNDDFDRSDHSDYSVQRWAPAIKLYESFVRSEPNNGRAWFNLGFALHYSREHAKAIDAFQHALALGYHKPVSTYNVACAYAMLNQRDSAFEWLDRALAAGFDSIGDLVWDKDLDSLRSDPRFKRFRDAANYDSKLRNKK